MGITGCFRSVRGAGFAQDAANVVGDRMAADAELVPDLPVAESGRDEAEDVDFPPRQIIRSTVPPAMSTLPTPRSATAMRSGPRSSSASTPTRPTAGAIRDWCVGYWDATHPYSAGGAYVNFMMDEGQDRVRATYRQNYDRLARVKAQYDPDNVFHVIQNIHPATSA